MIDRVSIRQFKRLREITCTLGKVTGVVGANNSGKTSLLQALHFSATAARSARLFSQQQWADDVYETEIATADLLYTPSDQVDRLFGDTNTAEIELASDGAICRLTFEQTPTSRIRLRLEGRVLGEQLQSVAPPFSMYAPGLAGISRREESISQGVLVRAVDRGDANSVLRNVLHRLLRDRAMAPRFSDSMQRMFPGIEFRYRFDEEVDQYVSIDFRTDPQSLWLPLDSAGNGILQAAQLFAYTELFEPRILILDEPDSHLHPENQRKLSATFWELARERDLQVLFATHSRHILDAATVDVTLLWVANGTTGEPIDAQFTPMLLDIGALDAIDHIRSTHPRCVVATEDGDTTYLRTLLAANGFQLGQTEVLSYTGCSNIDSALVLSRYLRLRAPGTVLVVHLDRDYRSDEEVARIRAELAAAGVSFFVTDGNDVEHRFIDPTHLAAVTGVAVERATEMIADTIAATRDASLAELVRQRNKHAFRRRNAQGGNVDPGNVAVSAFADYEAAPAQMCHGKTVIAQLRQALNREIRDHPRITDVSTHLAVPSLTSIAAVIWPAPTT